MLLVALCTLGAVLGRIQNASRTRGQIDPISWAIQSVFSPLAQPMLGVARWSNDFWSGAAHGRELTAEVSRLQSQVRAAQLYLEQAELMRGEVDSLRKLLKLTPQAGRTPIAVDVIAFYPHEHRITLSRGSGAGIGPGMPVVGATGLIGIVQTVAPKMSQALLLTSPQITVGAKTMGTSSQAGLLKGMASDNLVLDFTDSLTPIAVGDKVVTSGYSELIPGLIPIGQVIDVENQPEFGLRRVKVAPNFRTHAMREVVVLK